jgi:hypothetical protein
MLTDEQIRNIHEAMDVAEKIASGQEKLRDPAKPPMTVERREGQVLKIAVAILKLRGQ